MVNQLASLYLSLAEYLAPVRQRLSSLENVEYLFLRYGWEVNLDEEIYGRIEQTLAINSLFRSLSQAADKLRDKLDADGEALKVSDISALATIAGPLLRALSECRPDRLSELPEPLNQEQLWDDVADHLPDDLLEEYLRIYQPAAYLLLHFWGVIRYDVVRPSGSHRRQYVRTSVDWEQAVAMLRNPLAALQQTYAWGDE